MNNPYFHHLSGMSKRYLSHINVIWKGICLSDKQVRDSYVEFLSGNFKRENIMANNWQLVSHVSHDGDMGSNDSEPHEENEMLRDEVRKKAYHKMSEIESTLSNPPTAVAGPVGQMLSVLSGKRGLGLGSNIKDKIQKEVFPESSFIDEVKILFIPGVDRRLICYFLGTTSSSDLKYINDVDVSMIEMMKMQTLVSFMKTKGYDFSEELNINDRGERINVTKHTWHVNKKPVVFSVVGYIFFEHRSGDKNKNVVMINGIDNGYGFINCCSLDEKVCSSLLVELTEYSKKNNILRGVKMRDVDIKASTYEEVCPPQSYNWENYYYPKRVIDLFNLEIFGFLNDTEKYNKHMINKRGFLLHGSPGTGKTSIGYIICNYAEDSTVLWVTPDLVSSGDGRVSIKLMYRLADYLSPAVVILEDIDLFTEDRDSVSESVRLGTIMNILDGVNSIKNSVTIAMTNRIELIEKALSNRPGRFDRIVKIPELDETLRRKMLESRLSDCFIDDNVLNHIVKDTDGWTGAHLQEFVSSINMHFIRENDKSREVTMDKANEALDQMLYFSTNSRHNGDEKGKGYFA